MPRAPRYPSKATRSLTARDARPKTLYCRYCKQNRDPRGYDRHFQSCKAKHERATRIQGTSRGTRSRLPAGHSETYATIPDDVEMTLPDDRDFGNNNPEDNQSEDANAASTVQSESVRAPVAQPGGASHFPSSGTYIIVEPHPKDRHSHRSVTTLSEATSSAMSTAVGDHQHLDNLLDAARPWAPWPTIHDFQYAETALHGLLKPEIIDKQLKGIAGSWTGHRSEMKMKNYKDYQRALNAARVPGVNFRSHTINPELWGEIKHYTFYYRDPWEWILSLVTDPSLARLSTWKSQRKFYREDRRCERFVDEPWTADTWCAVDDQLPELPQNSQHCWLPLHIWLDKGMVTSHVKMFPIVLRALWLPSEIRNAAGNGGGVLIGFMVEDPGNTKDRSDRKQYEFAQFKREVYQQVFEIIFQSLFKRSWHGEMVACGDRIDRILYPGVLVESMDMEEAWNFTCTRSGQANFPCPTCLVPQDMLDSLLRTFEPRTTETMRDIVNRARTADTVRERDQLLKDHGLHDITHFLWNFRFSDPYQSVTYDLLHFDESGKWGGHLWELILKVIGDGRMATDMTQIMSGFPRWRGLKHINDLATKDFTDGQTHLDILKCIVFVVVQLLPAKSSLVHCIRSLLQYRMMLGLKVLTESRIARVEHLIQKYERYCKDVAREHGKNFCFPKQHWTSHAVRDIWAKGALRNATTRLGEGMHQDVAQHFSLTNMRNADKQVAQRDEDQEAIARTRMIVDDFFARVHDGAAPGEDEEKNVKDEARQFKYSMGGRKIPKSRLQPGNADNHWILGSAGNCGDSRTFTTTYASNDPVFRGLDGRLRTFLQDEFLDETLGDGEPIVVQVFRCLYITYASKDDWKTGEDILRCNNNWYNQGPRYDWVLFNTDTPGLACARLRSLVRCKLPSGRIVDLAIVNAARASPWRPRTVWDGCEVLEESKLEDLSFLLLDWIIRGALLVPVRPVPNTAIGPRLHFFVDVVDNDMYLRALNAKRHVCL
ncbi:hypothetical protein GGX14DRAFT_572859 [Mycena pura]|uniref:Uncharacterized protein n=1 Tax=Mycena pura TaxID=153505 RepID=A0AAD6Y6N2_9AGAR|nr:hypothetical protein GGX14DRAFT_572859 [Mycena pura]